MSSTAETATTVAALRPLTTREFASFQALIYREAGIWLSEAKRALVVGRLQRRLRVLELSSFSDYLSRVEADPDERVQMLNCICTNETHFFREPAHFDFLDRFVIPQWKMQAGRGEREKRVRIWSAGCSTGEEPYSLAMTLLEHLEGWEVQILASDLSTKVLDHAVAAVWPLAKSSEIPQNYLKKYMLRGTRNSEGKMKAGLELREAVQFHQVNLNDDRYPVVGRFDAIFCRNVMIYFDAESKKRVCDRLLDRLAPTGYFFVGHAESLTGITPRVQTVVPTVYRLKDGE